MTVRHVSSQSFGRIFAWVLGVLILVPIFAILAAILLLNINPGRRLVERLAGQLTAGQVEISGLGGRFPDALRLAHAEVHDKDGAWLILDDVALNWSPLALLHKEARVDLLTAGRVQVPRLPVASTSPGSSSSSQPFSLPVHVSVQALHIARAEIGAPVAGVAAVLALDGDAHLASLQDGDADVTIDRLDSPGSYEVHGRIDPTHLAAKLQVSEPAHGLISSIAKLPDLGAIALQASVDGPRTREVTALTLTAGPARATVNGTVDIAGQTADVDVVANAPAMTPSPRRLVAEHRAGRPRARPLHQARRHRAAAFGRAPGGGSRRREFDRGAARQPRRRRTACDGAGGSHPRAETRSAGRCAAGAAGGCPAGHAGAAGHVQPVPPAAAGAGHGEHRRRHHRACRPDGARPSAARRGRRA